MLKGLFAAVPYGDPQRPDVIMGPVISAKQRERVLGCIEKGKAEGATLAVGGGRPSGAEFAKGWWVEPTLFTDVDNSMTIAQQEIFGPVLVVIPFEDEDDAVRIANDSQVRAVRRGLLGVGGALARRGPAHPHRRPQHQRGRPLRAGPALRRVQAQRHRPPERRRRVRAVPRGQVAGLAGGLSGEAESRRDRHQPSPEIYYDPYDFEIDADPYPVWKRMRDEAPLYWNEKYEFFALSRWDDVERGHARLEDLHLGPRLRPRDHQGRRRDPARVDPLRGPAGARPAPCACSRGSSRPRRCWRSSPRCGPSAPRCSTRSSASGGFDFIEDLGQVHADAGHRHAARHPRAGPGGDPRPARRGPAARGGRPEPRPTTTPAESAQVFSDYITWRAEHPSDDLMTELLNAEFEDETGTTRTLTHDEILDLRRPAGRGRERDDDPPHRLHRRGPRPASRPARASWWRTRR